ncbi:hypothetical protein [Flavobacterium sp.]|uniref:hypothetical protein n=1 Tax=Flavobacterium sp. TaxID=239 RepID=UPI00404834B3
MENLEGGRRFWGWTAPEDIQWGNCGPDGQQYATVVYYTLWLENGTKVISRAC